MSILGAFLWHDHVRNRAQTAASHTQAAAGEAFAFVVQYHVPKGFAFPEAFSIEPFKGLLLCEIIQETEGDVRLLAYWNRQENFTVTQPKFENQLGLPNPLAQGWQRDLKTEAPKWWHRFKRPDLLIAATASLLLAYGTIRSSYREWFALPQVDIYPADSGSAFEVVESTSANLRLAIKNASDWRAARVDLNQVFLATGLERLDAAIAVQVPTRSFPSVQAGDSKEFSILVPGLRTNGYTLSVVYTVKAGDLIPKHSQTNLFSLKVWPQHALSGPYNINVINARRCQYDGYLSSGLAFPRVRCSATLTRAPGVKLVNVASTLVSGAQYSDNQQPGNETAAAAWDCGPLTPMHTTALRFSLLSTTDRSPKDWTNICRSVEYGVQHNKGD